MNLMDFFLFRLSLQFVVVALVAFKKETDMKKSFFLSVSYCCHANLDFLM